MANPIRHGRRGALVPAPFGWEPFQSMRDLMQWHAFGPVAAPHAGSEQTFMPAFELRETRDEHTLEVDLPGLGEKDLELTLTGNRLHMSGTRTAEDTHEDQTYRTYERSYGSFARSFTVPEDTDLDRVDAVLANGVLTVHLPKRADIASRKIKIGKPLGNVIERVKDMLGVHRDKDEHARRPS
jgi:HSP20 family protein